ncbi:MAG: hypothetical protein MK085_03465 [Phycisphaerales bacterium]|nr:hypothetical protein [Phycisphaerales bacterium]
MVRMPFRLLATVARNGSAIIAGLLFLLATPGASAQAPSTCPGPPPGWQICGQCYGDLNNDGLLDQLDQLIFAIYRDQFPQNLCADFNNDGDVNIFDQQIIDCIINESNGACENQGLDSNGNRIIHPYCGPENPRSCFVQGDPSFPNPGGCVDPSCCQAVCDVSPTCCDDLWDFFCVNIAQNICEPLGPDTRPDVGNCLCEHSFSLPAGNCLDVHGFPRCTDERCTEQVCACEPLCCETTWDDTCVELAKIYCTQPCTNLVLSELVCQTLPQCCDSGEWDVLCTVTAANIVVNQPGLWISATPSNCLLCPTTTTYPTPACANTIFQSLICSIDPWYCDPVNFNANVTDCEAAVIAVYPECASDWNQACIQVASRFCRKPLPDTQPALGNCLMPHVGAGCGDYHCMSIVCECDPACCDTSMSWDEQCVELAATQCVLVPATNYLTLDDLAASKVGATSVSNGFGQSCGGETAGSCFFQQFTPYCQDAACCQLVCGYDAFCCDARWDTICADMALAACDSTSQGVCGPRSPLDGYPPPSLPYRSCFSARPTNFCDGYPGCSPAGCDRSDCCNLVCFVDPFCCEVPWDQVCADGADVLCSNTPGLEDCGSSAAGSCYVPHVLPYCDDAGCCERVCLLDPACCTTTWDDDCVLLAEAECTSCGDVYAGSCFSIHPGPACSDEDCCEAICLDDPPCCSDLWDGICVDAAKFGNYVECKRSDACGQPDSRRSCYLESYLPGCEDNLCCQELCKSFDPWCCEVRWDAVCASQALSVCPPGYPTGRGPCNEFHVTPSCNEPACAAAVCSIPGYEDCCNFRWDEYCVEAANWACTGLYECPGEGPCKTTNATPMCEDPVCCSVVCTYDPNCCYEVWDNGCAIMAITLCEVPNNPSTADWSCPCLGSCFEGRDPADPRPGCELESCCAAVCSIEPDCCTDNWDDACADLAVTYCGGGIQCGSWSTGSCLIPKDTPYCDDPTCCRAVCVYDPACCITDWDSFCVAQAAQRCLRGCGGDTAGPGFYPHPPPGCSDGECCDLVCDSDDYCCKQQWDDTCANLALSLCQPPACGEYASGNCCEVNFSPNCNDQRCCNAVCAVDTFCCDTTWDEACVGLAQSDPGNCTECAFTCGDPCAGSCCEANFTPACDDQVCCSAICAIDSFCCEDSWDIACASQARITPVCTDPTTGACPLPECGEPEAGDCCFPNGTPNCDDATCCNLVCAIDPLCCTIAWDSICSALANDPAAGCADCNTSLECGDSNAGDCCFPNGTPYCNDSACCELVCLFDELCCFTAWDEDCAELASKLPSCGCSTPLNPPPSGPTPQLKGKPKGPYPPK